MVQATGYGGTVAEGTVISSDTVVLSLLLRPSELFEASCGLIQEPDSFLRIRGDAIAVVRYFVLLLYLLRQMRFSIPTKLSWHADSGGEAAGAGG